MRREVPCRSDGLPGDQSVGDVGETSVEVRGTHLGESVVRRPRQMAEGLGARHGPCRSRDRCLSVLRERWPETRFRADRSENVSTGTP